MTGNDGNVSARPASPHRETAAKGEKCTRLVVEGKVHVGRPRKTWQNTLSADRVFCQCPTGCL